MKQRRKNSAPRKRKRDSGESPPVVNAQLPGQELERAAADVGRAAGKSVIQGLGTVFGAGVAGWIAEKEAKAEAKRMAIETASSIERSRTFQTERRQQELEEIQHEERKALAQRRYQRLLTEMEREEANFEAIVVGSLKQIEHHPDGDEARKIDEDWMFKFARYAQDVSDKQVQELWSRILTSAAIEGKLRISAAALQAMSLMDRDTAKDFTKFVSAYVTLGSYPLHNRSFPPHEPQKIALRPLQELGLIEQTEPDSYFFREFDIKLGEPGRLALLHSGMGFTQRGSEIANALFSEPDPISDELTMKYLQDVIEANIDRHGLHILPKINRNYADYAIQLRKSTGVQLPGVDSSYPTDENLPERLQRLIAWSAENYNVSRTPVLR
jgi:hypothetical protein